MKELVIITSGHHPEDGRLTRHLRTLREAGYEARVVALTPASRSQRLFKALPFLAKALRTTDAQVVIFPDPELFIFGSILGRLRGLRTLIDVHEDYHAVALRRTWIPAPARPLVALMADLNQWLGRTIADGVVVAASHLSRPGDIVVTNLPAPGLLPAPSPPPQPRAVYVGDISSDRGVEQMLQVLARVTRLRLDLIGPLGDAVHSSVKEMAQELGVTDRLTIHGRLPYLEAWRIATGATAGLSLLRPTPAYVKAIPTKVWEYFACGLPVIATNLPGQTAIVVKSGGGVVVQDVVEAAAVINRLIDDPATATAMGDAGYRFYLARAAEDGSVSRLLQAVSAG